MLIRKNINNLARIQNYPIGNLSNYKEDGLNTEPQTPKHSETTSFPHGLNTPTHKIHTKPSQPTESYKALTKKRKYNQQ